MQKLIPRIIGLLLLAAAALKLHGLGVAPVSAMGWFSTAWFQVALVEGEVLLGLWLLSGAKPFGAQVAALTVFIAFACVSFYQGLLGRTSCGCFGRLAITPWFAFGIDIVALAALALARPDIRLLWHEPRAALFRPLCVAGGWLAGGIGVFAVLGAMAAFEYGSLDAATAHFRGERVPVRPGLVDVGSGVVGQTKEVTVVVSNYTEAPVSLVGGTSDCSCVTTGDLPLKIPSGESRSVAIALRLRGKPGIFTRTAIFVTDDTGSRFVTFQLTGRNLPNPETSVAAKD